ncbi:DUF1698 domain-containing protein [Thiohalocapsa marina]|uniref:DUF1698 domain-containing protein n=1 Tax=Thiohalocapsa marina TaxID=424902 RepID=UPI0036D99104
MLEQRFAPFFQRLDATRLAPWRPWLQRLTRERLSPGAHGDLAHWIAALEALPWIAPAEVVLDRACVGVGICGTGKPALDAAARARLAQRLDAFHPWRKGPFCLHGVHIDSEWRSDWKWTRLQRAIAPLHGRLVLDLGCGNGYYAYRALGAGAALVLGVDPTLRFVLQFLALDHFIRDARVAVLPLADTDLFGAPPLVTDQVTDLVRGRADRAAVGPGAPIGGFDTVFSMGVLYHRRDAAQHLAGLRRLLRPGGELVLETLILDAPGDGLFRPPGRYAKMRNVHAIPTLNRLTGWLSETGLRRVRCVDVTRTTGEEQRATAWMRFQSLADFLDPADACRTVEGHPAPTRAILLAER